MTRKLPLGCAVLLFAAHLLTAPAAQAQPVCDCPGSSYSPCHYNFPLLWRFCACLSFRCHAPAEMPPPFSASFYVYRSHCPYAAPAALLGFPSMVQRAKLDGSAAPGR
jgi:hypothetical protein